MDDYPSLEAVAANIRASAHAFRQLLLSLGAVIGLGLMIRGLYDGATWYQDQRRSVLPIIVQPLAGMALLASGYTWYAQRLQLFAVESTYTYAAAVALHRWELALLQAVSEVARVVGIGAWLYGWALLSGAGKGSGAAGESRVAAGVVCLFAGFFLAEHALVITLVEAYARFIQNV